MGVGGLHGQARPPILLLPPSRVDHTPAKLPERLRTILGRQTLAHQAATRLTQRTHRPGTVRSSALTAERHRRQRLPSHHLIRVLFTSAVLLAC